MFVRCRIHSAHTFPIEPLLSEMSDYLIRNTSSHIQLRMLCNCVKLICDRRDNVSDPQLAPQILSITLETPAKLLLKVTTGLLPQTLSVVSGEMMIAS